jgi:hypothetical protein
MLAFEKHLFNKQIDLLTREQTPPALAKAMAQLCKELSVIISSKPIDVNQRIAKLREMYDLLLRYGYDLPN